MRPSEILESRRTADAEIEVLELQIAKLQDDGRPKGYSPGKAPEKVPGKDAFTDVGRTTNNPKAMKGQHEDGYRQKLEETLREQLWIKNEAENMINALNDGATRVILRCYYCECKNDSQIGELIGLGRRAVCVKRNKAVDFLDEHYEVCL